MSEQNIITSTSNLSTLLSNPEMRRPLSPHPLSLNQDIRTTSMLNDHYYIHDHYHLSKTLLMLERKTLCANTCGQTPASQARPLSSLPHTHHHRVASPSRALRTMQPVSTTCDLTFIMPYLKKTSFIRLSSNSSRVGKEIRSQPYSRHGCKRLPRTPRTF